MLKKSLMIFIIVFFAINDSNLYSEPNDTSVETDQLFDTTYSSYALIIAHTDTLVMLADSMLERPKPDKISDSIFCNKIYYNIKKLKKYINDEFDRTDKELGRKKRKLVVLDSERARIAKYFLIAVAILSVVLLVILYSRYRIISETNKKLAEKQEEVGKTNEKLRSVNDDLLEHKKKLEKLNIDVNDANEKLKQSEKTLLSINSSKDKFFSIISHDLRNPFASIASFSRIIKRDIDTLSKDELKELAGELDKSIVKINTLLDNLLVWSRSQSGKTPFNATYINLAEVVSDTVELLKPNANEKELEIKIDLPDDLVVYADKNMLEVILRNLISNAIKYSHSGSEISVKADSKNEKAVITIKDYGVGIEEEDKEKLFDPELFFSTYGTADEKGSGLGLIITKEFVEKQGGKICFNSEKGEGAEFTFSVPLEE